MTKRSTYLATGRERRACDAHVLCRTGCVAPIRERVCTYPQCIPVASLTPDAGSKLPLMVLRTRPLPRHAPWFGLANKVHNSLARIIRVQAREVERLLQKSMAAKVRIEYALICQLRLTSLDHFVWGSAWTVLAATCSKRL